MSEKKMKVLAVFGTRPEAIKMAPLIKRIGQTSWCSILVCVTAQHREMLDTALSFFGIKADFDLDLMAKQQSVTDITIRVLQAMEALLQQVKPDLVLVHGDTTTSAAAALASFYQKIPVGHVEAGLRSGNIYSPYPEEMNRRMTGVIAELHFAPTGENRQNLLLSGVKDEQIFVTGNTVIDALQAIVRPDFIFPIDLLNQLDFENRKVLLLTAHRRENQGSAMRAVLDAVAGILHNHPDTELIFPVHLNPAVKCLAEQVLGQVPRAHLITPLRYDSFVNVMARSYLILTDSGGIQEEAPALGIPVIVFRAETERPEAVRAGAVILAGVDGRQVYEHTHTLLSDRVKYETVARAVSPYGDGNASERIVTAMYKWFFNSTKPSPHHKLY